MGIVSPVGNSIDEAWNNVIAGHSGISQIDAFDASALTTRIAGTIKNFDITQHLPAKEARKIDPFIHYGIVAAKEALANSGLEINAGNAHRVAVAMGSGSAESVRSRPTTPRSWPVALERYRRSLFPAASST